MFVDVVQSLGSLPKRALRDEPNKPLNQASF